MTDKKPALDYGHPQRRKVSRLLIAGPCLMVVAGGMMLVGGSIFVMPTAVSPAINWLGGICLFGWMPMGLGGLAMLIVGLVRISPP